MRKILYPAMIALGLVVFTVLPGFGQQCTSGFKTVRWGLTIQELRTMFPEQTFTKDKTATGDPLWKFPIVMDGKDFTGSFIMRDGRTLDSITLHRTSKEIEKDTIIAVAEQLTKAYGAGEKTNYSQVGDVAAVAYSFKSEYSVIKLELTSILGQKSLMVLNYSKRPGC
jgi:hypothetical protein